MEKGVEALADQELLQFLFTLIQPNSDCGHAVELSFQRLGSFGSVITASSRDLLAIPGMSDKLLMAMMVIRSSAVRLTRCEIYNKPILSHENSLIQYLNVVQGREPVEHVRILFLDSRNRLILDEYHAHGTINKVSIYPREIARRSLELNATAVILVHNHPSGDPRPSVEDKMMTAELIVTLSGIDVTVQDHIIVGRGEWFSFRREKLF